MTASAYAQKGNAVQKAAVNKLRWMTGAWTGSSEVSVDGQTQITAIQETVRAALDGTILQINVSATDKDSNTQHRSLAYTSFSVISYDLRDKTYRWTTWRNNGDAFDQKNFKVGDNSFEYTDRENGSEVRYKAVRGSKGEFLETGEYSKNGTDWTKFITMKLVRVH